MGIVVSTSLSYATADDLTAFGVPGTVSSDQLDDALELAVETINMYTGTFFGAPQTTNYVVDDVRRPLITLPTPFANVTQVQVNSVNLDSTLWIIEPWGLRLWQSSYDSDGFPRYQYNDGMNGFAHGSGLWGSQVTVSATYGYTDVPARVRRATIMLAARFATATVEDQIPDSRLKQLQVEGYRVAYDDTNVNLDTTGDLSVDRLLRGYRGVEYLVG